jgi:hypothetical protein
MKSPDRCVPLNPSHIDLKGACPSLGYEKAAFLYSRIWEMQFIFDPFLNNVAIGPKLE